MKVFDELKLEIIRSPLSTAAIARRSKVAPITLLKWLDGSTQGPLLDTAVRVAAVLGKRFELIDGEVRLVPIPFDTPASVAAKAAVARHVARMAAWRFQ